ncbi:MAG: hypothetical protein CME06_05360 [Gemmatimonadetes bacterium]|nr:hypothetical protein [Gemmatimonadota bacterium]
MRNFATITACMLVAGTAGADLVITEIMQNPAAVTDSNGEYFEVYNSGASAVDMDGYTIVDNDSDDFVVSGTLLVPAGGYVVFGKSANDTTNGGVAVDYEFGSSMALANGGDEIVIMDADSLELDRVEWDGGPLFPDPTGASMSLGCYLADNNDGANWFESMLTSYGDGDFGTPGADNEDAIVVTVSDYPDSVSVGTNATFNVTLENITCGALTNDAWIHATGDVVDQTVKTQPGVTLPGMTSSGLVPISLPVPPSTPLGVYDVDLNVGTLPSDAAWTDGFSATVY